MRLVLVLPILTLAISTISWRVDRSVKAEKVNTAGNAVTGLVADIPDQGQSDLIPSLNRVSSYDYAKCIESCDKQYESCAKGGDAERVKYCSNQHDRCRKACLEHK
jgi:hypothetical protein